jgi:hypothetical protein
MGDALPDHLGVLAHVLRSEGAQVIEALSLLDPTACAFADPVGMAGHAWPRPALANPLFTDSEIAQIKAHTGLAMRTRADVLNRRLELFRRQICAASNGATLLVPARDAAGKPLAPATALALIGRALKAAKPEDLVTDLRALATEAWPVANRLTAPQPGGGAPEVPDTGILRIGTDLLRIRREDDGRGKPQSPSRLETLIVSPLAWVLEELGAKDRTWAPEGPDVMILGSIVDEVLEILFPKAAPVPDTALIEAGADAALDTAIGIHAPFLAATDWAAERASLAREIRRVAQGWARFLTENGAEILDNEFQLAGDQRGLCIAGRDNTAKNINVPGTGRFPVGIATEAAGHGITSVAVRLDSVATVPA